MPGQFEISRIHMLDPRTPVMPGALRIWERELKEATAAVVAAQNRLAYATRYLDELKRQREEQTK